MAALVYPRPKVLKQIPHDRHSVIEASAGTGKTFIIEHLMMDLLLETECSIEQVLVVTFTEKATEELRGRIRSLLENMLSGSVPAVDRSAVDLVEISDAGRRKLERALFSFDKASIHTIHAFCRRTLTDLAFETGTPLTVDLVDARRVFHRAFRSELRETLAVEESTRALLDEWLTDGETARFPNLVDSLEDLLRQCHFNRYLQSDEPKRNDRAFTELAESFDAGLLKELCTRKNKRPSVDIEKKIEELAAIIRRNRRESPEQLRRELAAFAFESFPYRTANSERKAAANLVTALEAAEVASSLNVRVVDTFLPRVNERLRTEKRKFNEIDYGDMLEWLWESLKSQSLIALLRERFCFALVDEFQDTDELQWKIFRKVFLESSSRNTISVVGDPKQAIYSFRGADVFTYLDARREILDAGGVGVKLTENYRSTHDMVDALNGILDDKVSPPVFSGQIRYDTPLTCARPDLVAHDYRGNPIRPVTLLRYRPATSAPVARLRASIGRHIASEIRKILFEPERAIAVSDNSGSRLVGADGIYILTRTGAEGVEIGSYLREQGVPFAFYKKEGLFQTGEAYDVLDVLKAVEEPNSHSKCLKAWISPFFAVPYPDLFDCGEIPGNHPLSEHLREWNVLAEQERFGRLFDQLVHQSGLFSRELFLANSERELTNYLHIFEILMEQAAREQMSLKEIIARLESFIAGTALPSGIDSNIQKRETDRSAVQIMTVHLSKGLQADVVFVFGGTGQTTMPPRVCAYHDAKHERRVAVGAAGRAAGKPFLECEAREENERLAYVAITRARAKVYLPVFPEGSTRRRVNGYYEPLNDRLKILTVEAEDGARLQKCFELVDVEDAGYDAQIASSKLTSRMATWVPPTSLLASLKDGTSARIFDRMRIRARPMQTRSYTSLEHQAKRQLESNDIETDEFKYDVESRDEGADLKGGRRIGIFLHEVIENIDLESFRDAHNLQVWRERSEVRRVFTEVMRANQINDPRWFDRGSEIVFNALTSLIAISSGELIGPLYQCDSIREMEFVFPIPERNHSLLESAKDDNWTAERGYLKGFVDFVFKSDDKYYFADWKSDSLPSYDHGSIDLHVHTHYDLQAAIYAVGIVRLLGIRNEKEYQERFGGLLYLFIRGIKATQSDEGVYFRRPDWLEVCRYEAALIGAVRETESPR